MNIIELPARNAFAWIKPAELRALLKLNLGLNARQVSVSKRHSLQYLTVTIRDASVNIKMVEDFSSKFSTWTMDNTDYVEGQSISVELSDEVKDSLAAQKRATVESSEIPAPNQLLEIVEGIYLCSDSSYTWLERKSDYKRTSGVWTNDLAMKRESTINHLALQLALLTA